MKHRKLFSLICVTSILGGAAMAGGDKLQFSADDQDGNGAVSQTELISSIEDKALFDSLDENDNSVLEEDEADESDVVDYDEITDLDKGGYIDRSEFALAVFDQYDSDNDNQLDEGEYEDFSEQVSEALES
jgi:hypothetical protein